MDRSRRRTSSQRLNRLDDGWDPSQMDARVLQSKDPIADYQESEFIGGSTSEGLQSMELECRRVSTNAMELPADSESDTLFELPA